jgi:hypothetical protein
MGERHEVAQLRREVILLTRTVNLYEEIMEMVKTTYEGGHDLDGAMKMIQVALKAGRAGE